MLGASTFSVKYFVLSHILFLPLAIKSVSLTTTPNKTVSLSLIPQHIFDHSLLFIYFSFLVSTDGCCFCEHSKCSATSFRLFVYFTNRLIANGAYAVTFLRSRSHNPTEHARSHRHTVEILWTNDQLRAETATHRKHDKSEKEEPCPLRD
jgi:hypothetical protein